MTPSQLLILLLVILASDFIFETVLDWVNARHQPESLPKVIEGLYSKDEFDNAQAYQNANFKIGLISSVTSFVMYFVVISTGALGAFSDWLTLQWISPYVIFLTFFGSIMIVTDLLGLPISLYKTFVIESKFGFNKMTVKTFFLDKIKGYAIAGLIGSAMVWVFLHLIDWLNEDFWLFFWGVITIILVFVNMFYTSLIVPLFNKLEPLEDGELREAIELYSKKVNFPLTNIYVINGSKRSTKANAYFSGLGPNKKIVLYDTLINNHTTEELVAVLAHEVGHFKRKHIISGLGLSILQMGLILFVLSFFIFNENLSKALGASELAIHLNLIAFSMLFTPISKISGLLMSLFSRKNEYEADAFAAETSDSKALSSALKTLSTKNLSNLTPHPSYVFFHYSHPPLVARLNALEELNDS